MACVATRSAFRTAASQPGRSGVSLNVDRRCGLRGWRSLAGEISSAGGARSCKRAGIAVCLTFVWLSAPDLALTQLLVEIVTTVLLLLGLRWLPKRIPFNRTLAGAKAALPRRLRDFVIASACGSSLGLLSYAVMTRRCRSFCFTLFH